MVDILVFGAHPDDAEFGMGASILKFREQGKSVLICVLTRGECGTHGTPDERVTEMHRAAEKAGAQLKILDFKDNQVIDTYENRLKIARVIREHKPRILFAPYHTIQGYHRNGRAHPDHSATGELVRAAARYAKFKNQPDLLGALWDADHILYYMVPDTLCPTFVHDVTNQMARWEEVAKCHTTQMNLRGGKVLETLRTIREAAGIRHGCGAAELFYCEEPAKLDIEYLMK